MSTPWFSPALSEKAHRQQIIVALGPSVQTKESQVAAAAAGGIQCPAAPFGAVPHPLVGYQRMF